MGHTFTEKVASKLTGNAAKNYQAVMSEGKLNFEAIALQLALADKKAKYDTLLEKVTEALKPLYLARGQKNGEWLTKRFAIYTKIALKQRNAIMNAEKAVRKAKAPKAKKEEKAEAPAE